MQGRYGKAPTRGGGDSLHSQAQSRDPFRNSAGVEGFAQQLACAVCPAPVTSAPSPPCYLPPLPTSSGFLPSLATASVASQWQSRNLTSHGWLYTHSPPIYSTSCCSHHGRLYFPHFFLVPSTPLAPRSVSQVKEPSILAARYPKLCLDWEVWASVGKRHKAGAR